MKTPRRRITYSVCQAMRPPTPNPPVLPELLQSLRIDPMERTRSETDTILRYLILNKRLLNMLENSQRMRAAAQSATLVTISNGDVLFYEGDDRDGWYLVLDGTVDVVIRLCLLAEDCFIDPDPQKLDPYAQLMEQMELTVQDDKLKRIAVLKPGQIFGHQSYLLDRPRTATVVGSSDTVDLIKLDSDLFRFSHAFYAARDHLNTHKELCRSVFPRLNNEKLTMITVMSDIITLKPGTKITPETSLGKNLYVIKSGTVNRYKVIDFSDVSFRKIHAPFEGLELHFPDGERPVHTDDLTAGMVFADPSITSLRDSEFRVDKQGPAELFAIDLSYFETVVGAAEMRLLTQTLRNRTTDEEAMKIWVEAKKQRLWTNFKAKEIKKSHKHLKGEKEFLTSTVALRTPRVPKSMKTYRPKKVVPYASKSLR